MRDQVIPLIELSGRAKDGYQPKYDDYLVDLRIKCQKREGELPNGDLDLALKALSLTPDCNCWDIKRRIWQVLKILEDPIPLRGERKTIIERNFDNAADIPILAKGEGKLILTALNLDVLTTGQVETEKALLARILQITQINEQTAQKHKDTDVIDDLRDHQKDYNHLSETEKDSIIKARIGQGIFRQQLIQLWGGCSVTGFKNEKFLKASHIKPWRDSSNQERLDKYNGLLLVPNLDRSFRDKLQ